MVKERKSNIECLRIIMMIVVVCHHYVVNSGIPELYTFTPSGNSGNMLFYEIFGCGGKIAIDVFLLISGYFMCMSNATLFKWLKLFFEYIFYNIVINLIFMAFGYAPFGYKELLSGFFPLFDGYGIGKDSFISLYLVLFLLIPFLNKLIHSMDRREYRILLAILLFFFTVISSFYLIKSENGSWVLSNNWEGLGWYSTVYLIGGYIRLHLPENKISGFRTGLAMTILSAVLVCASIIGINYIRLKEPGFIGSTHLVYGGNKILAITSAVSLFWLFLNMKIKYSRLINTVSSATFGVLMIHANSNTMRHFIWVDLFQNTSYYNVPLKTAALRAICVVAIVYVSCVILDLLRQKLIEAPLVGALEKIKFLKKPMY